MNEKYLTSSDARRTNDEDVGQVRSITAPPSLSILTSSAIEVRSAVLSMSAVTVFFYNWRAVSMIVMMFVL